MLERGGKLAAALKERRFSMDIPGRFQQQIRQSRVQARPRHQFHRGTDQVDVMRRQVPAKVDATSGEFQLV